MSKSAQVIDYSNPEEAAKNREALQKKLEEFIRNGGKAIELNAGVYTMPIKGVQHGV